MRIILRHPALTYGSIGLILNVLVHATRAAYDAGGLEGLLFWTAQLFGLPFWAVSEPLFSWNGGQAINGHYLISVVLGLLLCMLFDLVVRGVVRWRRIGTGKDVPLNGPSRIFLKNPALTFWIIGMALQGISRFAGAAYDAGGWKGLLYWTAALYYLPCLIVGDLLFWLNDGHAVRRHVAISIVGGLILCLVFDFALRGIVRWRRRVKAHSSRAPQLPG